MGRSAPVFDLRIASCHEYISRATRPRTVSETIGTQLQEAAVMSRMLTFHDAVWASACAAASAGRRADALASLAPLLSGAADVPERFVLLAHRLAGRVHTAAERYAKARKHLLAASKLDPRTAEIHFELGRAFENDPYGCDRRAARRFLRAVKLDPAQARFSAAAGRALVRINRVTAGVRRLLSAAAAAPTDAAVLAVVVDGLCDAGRVTAATGVVTKARFLAPGDTRVARLWDEVRYAAARRHQQRNRVVAGSRPVLLSFPRIAGQRRVTAGGGGIVRRDAGSRTAPHVGRLRAFRNELG